jgi:hypothetical protein
MNLENLNAIDHPNGTIVITSNGLDEILVLTPVQALQLASSLKNAANNHCIEILRLIKES